jgi:hypothetical protein
MVTDTTVEVALQGALFHVRCGHILAESWEVLECYHLEDGVDMVRRKVSSNYSHTV